MKCVFNNVIGTLGSRLLKIDQVQLYNITSSSFGATPAGDAPGNRQCKN